MDNRLVFAVLFVTLSWMSVGTYAQSSTNSTATNVTTTNSTATNMTTAMPGSNATTAMPGSNATTAMSGGNATTAMPGSNATTAMSGGNATTAMSGGNATTAMSGGNATTAMPSGNATVATTAAPLTPNTTVETLEANITRAGCGTEQLCAAEPSDCDPSTGSCFFLGAKQRSGRNFDFNLAGESDGYLAATLSTGTTLGGGDGDNTYVCANNNGVVQFFSRLLKNGELTVATLNVNSVKGKVTGKKIECTFAATVPESSTRATNLALAISTGPFNSTSGALGTPNIQLKSAPVNLENPNTTVTNEVNATNTTSAPATTSHGITLQQSVMQALLILAGVLGLAML